MRGLSPRFDPDIQSRPRFIYPRLTSPMSNAVLLPILYAGLAGTLLALIIASAQQKWSLRVFFLLALRLAIGWHFLFEGLHKIHSVYAGPGANNRVFSSEM